MRAKLIFAGLFASSVPLLGLSLFEACKTNVIVPPSDDGDGVGGSGGSTVTLVTVGGLDAGFDAYVDPPCPTTPPPILDYQCDAYNQGNGDCQDGYGCYIYIDYPSGKCEAVTYGSLCLAAGTGEQGDPCDGPQACAVGESCVITGAGTQCVVLCKLTGEDTCTDGTICEPIDVNGFGGCL